METTTVRIDNNIVRHLKNIHPGMSVNKILREMFLKEDSRGNYVTKDEMRQFYEVRLGALKKELQKDIQEILAYELEK